LGEEVELIWVRIRTGGVFEGVIYFQIT